MLEKIARFMMGRYGGDKLNIFILIIGMVFSMLSSILLFPAFIIVSYIFWIFALFRIFSRNISARRKEYFAFMKFYGPFENWFKFKKTVFNQRKAYKYFTCPKCKQKLRAPKGRGKIEVTCQKCHTTFKKKT